ncbi:MAG: elongation factor Ts [Alphaproteobacteria bacterium]|nr:elongation factor Ts [Alphaproteobacteria bacterium]
MPEISAALVRELRERTGAGMMECKRALDEASGDVAAAIDVLRKRGLTAAAKKGSRIAADGLVGVCVFGTSGVIVEVNSETDFVARNPAFQALTRAIAEVAHARRGEIDAVLKAPYPGQQRSVAEEITHQIATLGENLTLRRTAHLAVGQGVLASYVHSAVAPGLGTIGVLVAIESRGAPEPVAAFGRQLAMHIAAANPQAVTADSLPAALVAHERKILREQARQSGKPDAIVEKMVEGRLRKYYEEVVLLEQPYVVDPEVKVGAALAAAAEAAGAAISVTGFVRFQRGEGIEKKQADFAAEVAAQAAR